MSVPVLPDPRERCDTGGIPCAGGACPTPGGTPSFLALSPSAGQRRRARLTGRLPHGPRCKREDPCCQFDPDARWTESLPWRPSPICALKPCSNRRQRKLIGCQEPKSQFRTTTHCGRVRSRGCCTKSHPKVDCKPAPCADYELFSCQKEKSRGSCRRACVREDDENIVLEELSANSDGTVSYAVEYDGTPARIVSEDLMPDGTRMLYLEQVESNSLCNEFNSCFNIDAIDSLKTSCIDDVSVDKEKRRRRRHVFRPNQTLRACPSNQVKPVSETISGASPFSVGQRSGRSHPFRPRGGSRFQNGPNPNAFCNSLTCRFAGSNGPKELRQAICHFPPRTPSSSSQKR